MGQCVHNATAMQPPTLAAQGLALLPPATPSTLITNGSEADDAAAAAGSTGEAMITVSLPPRQAWGTLVTLEKPSAP